MKWGWKPVRMMAIMAVLAACLLLTARAAVDEAAKPLLELPAHYAEIATLLCEELQNQHIFHLPVDNFIASRAFDNYLERLDETKLYFLESDIASFQEHRMKIDDELKNGDLVFAYHVFEVFRERVRNRFDYVDNLLKKGFDLEVDEQYAWKRKYVPWPRDEKEWDQLWRKRIKDAYIRKVVAGELEVVPDPAEPDESGPSDEKTLSPEESGEEPANESADKSGDEPPEDPAETIRQQYRQHLTMLEDVDAEWVLQNYLSAFASAYDPHCEYMSPAAVDNFDIGMKLSVVGIGAVLTSEEGVTVIKSLVPGGPASGDKRDIRLRPGDKIVAVAQGDEESVSILHWPLYKSVRLIRGEKGTRVVLTVIPESDPTGATTRKVELIRDEVKLEDGAATEKIRNIGADDADKMQLGIISLPGFYADMEGRRTNPDGYRSSSRDVQKILESMQEKGVDGVLLDLRNNGGGSLAESALMTGLFIREGPTVLVRSDHVRVLPDEDPSVAYSGPLVLLISRLTASAAEILAGALQDYGRALIVGDSKTHGKGSVQSIVVLGEDGRFGSLKVTSGLFYRVTGSSTQLNGVSPDIVVSSVFDRLEVGEEFLRNPLEWTMVRSSMFMREGNLVPFVAPLTEKSEKRRQEDERFMMYVKMLDRIEELNEAEEISLNIDKRREMAKTEKELRDLQRSMVDDETEDDGGGNDFVMEEALKILEDFVVMSKEKAESK